MRAAVRNSGFTFPTAHITVSLAPAGMRKEGAVYDLPIAVALLAALLTAVYMLRASGAMDALAAVLSPVLGALLSLIHI